MKKYNAIDVLFVLLPDTLILDWAGPAEAFRIANQSLSRQSKPPAFHIRFVGTQSSATGSVGARISNIEALPIALSEPTWVVLLGSPDDAFNKYAKHHWEIMHWLHSISKQLCDQNSPNRLITICAGALLAAKAGLLANCSVTSHHTELENLKGIEPLCNVVSNRVFVVDAKRNIYSSAGITTGIDLAVHLIDDVCGPVIAARVAQTMVMPLRRTLNDPALSPFLQGRAHMHAGIHRLQDAITSDLSANWTLPKMASLANTSSRNLARVQHISDHRSQVIK